MHVIERRTIRTAIESLVLCEACTHGLTWHDGGGCSDCRCQLTREAVIEDVLAAARDDIRNQWRASEERYG